MSLGMKWRFQTPSPPPLGTLGLHYSTSLHRKGCSMLLKAQAPDLSLASAPFPPRLLGAVLTNWPLTACGPSCGSLSQPHASRAHPGPGAQTPGPSLVPGTERRQTASPELNGALASRPAHSPWDLQGSILRFAVLFASMEVMWLICGLPWTPVPGTLATALSIPLPRQQPLTQEVYGTDPPPERVGEKETAKG